MKRTFFILTTILASIYSCNTNNGETKNIKVSNRTTIELFWETFQKAVADRDIETLESLYAPEAIFNKFEIKAYQEKIAKGKASEIIATGETYEDREVYQFAMVFPSEGTADDGENEESMTSIYIWKNDKGEFEIFNVLEAG